MTLVIKVIPELLKNKNYNIRFPKRSTGYNLPSHLEKPGLLHHASIKIIGFNSLHVCYKENNPRPSPLHQFSDEFFRYLKIY
jgi:hypothetical protein